MEDTSAAVDFYFEDFELNRVFVTPEWEATPERITDFAAQYDPQYFHLDPVRARQSFFGGLVCGGYQTAAVGWALALKTGMFEKCAVAGIGVDDLRWLLPVREGDRVHLEFSLVEGTPSRSKPDIARVAFACVLKNQRGETVLTMKLLQLLRRRPV
jgi:acyl dehydratase